MAEDSVERQHRIAREMWERQREDDELHDSEIDRVRFAEGALARRCRDELGLEIEQAAEMVLKDVITLRRLRRVEHGEEDVPPKVWQAYAKFLWKAGRDDLVAEIAELYPEIKAS